MGFINKMKKKIQKSQAQIVEILEVPGFIRIKAKTLTQDVLAPDAVGGYIKFMIDEDSKMKSITIADNTDSTFTLDFVNHGGNGEIASYVRKAKVGDEFFFRGPGPSTKIDFTCERYFFKGDRSAYPAIRANIEKVLLKNKEVQIIVTGENNDTSFQKYFEGFPENVKVGSSDEVMSDRDFFWFAGEKSQMQKIKDTVLIPSNHYISSYWERK